MPPSNLLLASKIVIAEEPPQIRNIPGVPTAIAALSGVAERGPIRTPVFVTSFDEYVDTFGGYSAVSDLALAAEGFFRNGGTAAWFSRVVHYTDINDSDTATAVKGELSIGDRGGVAGPAVFDSADGPFDLEPGEILEVNIDTAGADALTLQAVAASLTSGNTEPFALVNGDTLVYAVKLPGSTTLSELKTITFLTADFVAIGAATAQEMVNVINVKGQGIKAELVGLTGFRILTDKRGSDADLVISATGTAQAAGKLNLATGTTSSAGPNNVADINAVTAAELAALLTALPLSAGTATVYNTTKLRMTGVITGVGGSVVITANTTALGIFAGVLPITQNGTAALESPSIKVIAVNEGTWIEDYSVLIEPATSGDSDRFNLRIKKGTSTKEIWPNLSMSDTDARYVETFINQNSGIIDIEDLFSPAVSPANMPKEGTFSSWANQDDGLVGLVDVDFTGTDAGNTGFYAFDEIDNITLLAVPGRSTSAVHNAMIAYCETHRVGSCFAVLDPPEGLGAQAIKTYVVTTAALKSLSEFGAIYWPRVKILNPSTDIFGTDQYIVVPPSGHLLGLYARVDASSPGGIYKPPAGIEKGILVGVLGFETDETLDERKRDVVFPERINPITSFDGTPRHVDGARTLKGDGNFPYISERRGVIYIQQSLKRGLLFAKQRNNDRRLRMEVKRAIQTFLLRQFDNGAFRGETASESFFVDVSDALNTPERIFAGELHARIGLATQKPAEFIILTFTQDTRALEERLSSELG